jgi:hypothetical protein
VAFHVDMSLFSTWIERERENICGCSASGHLLRWIPKGGRKHSALFGFGPSAYVEPKWHSMWTGGWLRPEDVNGVTFFKGVWIDR